VKMKKHSIEELYNPEIDLLKALILKPKGKIDNVLHEIHKQE